MLKHAAFFFKNLSKFINNTNTTAAQIDINFNDFTEKNRCHSIDIICSHKLICMKYLPCQNRWIILTKRHVLVSYCLLFLRNRYQYDKGVHKLYSGKLKKYKRNIQLWNHNLSKKFKTGSSKSKTLLHYSIVLSIRIMVVSLGTLKIRSEWILNFIIVSFLLATFKRSPVIHLNIELQNGPSERTKDFPRKNT